MFFHWKIISFYRRKTSCVMHGHAFVLNDQLFNSFKPGVPFMGQRQTEWPQL